MGLATFSSFRSRVRLGLAHGACFTSPTAPTARPRTCCRGSPRAALMSRILCRHVRPTAGPPQGFRRVYVRAIRVPASCMPYVPAQGSLLPGYSQGDEHGTSVQARYVRRTYAVRVPAPGVPCVPRTMTPHTGGPPLRIEANHNSTRTGYARVTLIR